MKTLFVFLNDRKRTLIPPNISLLKGMLEQNGLSTRVFDTSFYAEHTRLKEEDKKEGYGMFKPIDYSSIGVQIKNSDLTLDFLAEIESYRPDLVAFSTHSPTFGLGLRLAQALKKKHKDMLVLFGGVHVSIEPGEVISHDAVDLICLGEGEEAILELCSAIKDGKNITNIRNIWAKHNSAVTRNPLRPPMEMDDLPTPSWDGFSTIHHYAPYRGKLLKTALVEFSRTCPHSCGYCGNRILSKIYKESGIILKTRHKSPEKFIRELKTLKDKYGVEFMNVIDGTFLTFGTPVFVKLAHLYKKEIGLPFYVDSTVVSINKERARLLKEMGCICVNMGLESGDHEYRKKYLLKDFSDEAIVNGFKIVHEAGLEARAYNMMGLPFESRKQIFKTIALNRKVKVDSASVAIFVPYPGAYLRQLCIERGLIKKDHEVTGDATEPNIKSDLLSDAEVVGLYKTFCLYIKAPKVLYPLIRFCEGRNFLAERIRAFLLRIYN